MEFRIDTQWDSKPLDHDAVTVTLSPTEAGLSVRVDAPFFNDPPNPGGEAGKPFQKLWDYEVVEVFFLNHNRQYLEVELCPHGQHLVLMLENYRKSFKDLLPLEFTSAIKDRMWSGDAVIPWAYFPPGIERFNAYAIHGTGNQRTYETLFPVPQAQFDAPDFHRLEFFKEVDFESLWPTTLNIQHVSQFWTGM